MELQKRILANIDKLDWNELSKNMGAIPFLKRNLQNVNWKNVCKNYNMIDFY